MLQSGPLHSTHGAATSSGKAAAAAAESADNHQLLTNLEKLSWELSRLQSRMRKLDLEAKQAGSANGVETYKEQLDELECQNRKLNRQLGQTESEWRAKLQQSLDAAETLRVEARELRLKADQSDCELRMLRDEADATAKDLTELAELRAQVAHLKEQLSGRDTGRQELESRVSGHVAEQVRLRQALSRSEATVGQLQRRIGELECQLVSGDAERTELERRLAEAAELRQSADQLAAEQANCVQRETRRADEEVAKRLAVEKRLEEALASDQCRDRYEAEAGRMRDKVDRLKARLAELTAAGERSAQAAEAARGRVESELGAAEGRLAAKDARIAELEAQVGRLMR
uniref:CCDC144C domain-containing protein n=1 Tax=Macrostomum lignano TaxID=282301 RepID=A0A1I8H4X0_9PLAT